MIDAVLTPLASRIAEQARAQHAEVVGWRRQMHRHPELSFQEISTSNFLAQHLRGIDGLMLERPTPTSLVARLKGGQPGADGANGSNVGKGDGTIIRRAGHGLLGA